MPLQIAPIARAEMLIRKPVAEVFNAFVDPAVTSRFWFSRGSGKLEKDAKVKWYWDMYGVSADVEVKAFEENRRILIGWPTSVEWIFTERPDDTTFVRNISTGFIGGDDQRVAQAINTMGGFCLALAGCKAYLEHGIELNLVADHNPDAYLKTRS